MKNTSSEIKRSRGRPRFPDEISRREHLTVNVTESDKKAWREACKIFGYATCIGVAFGAVQELLKNGKK